MSKQASDEGTITNAQTTQNSDKPPEKRKRHPRRTTFLLLVLILVGVPVLIVGYLGFVPGLSTLMGANKPRDLGVRYTPADYQSFLSKTQATLKDFETAPDNPSKPGKKVVFADPQTVENVTFTQQEITAAVNSIKWEWMPLSNAQVKFGAGNTVEVSGNLNMQHIDDFVKFIGGVGYSDADVNKAISWGEKMVGNAAVYVKGTASVANDSLTLNVQQVQVGRYSAPVDIANRVFQTGTTNALTRADNFEAKSVTFTSDAMHFSGTYPKTVYVRQAPTN